MSDFLEKRSWVRRNDRAVSFLAGAVTTALLAVILVLVAPRFLSRVHRYLREVRRDVSSRIIAEGDTSKISTLKPVYVHPPKASPPARKSTGAAKHRAKPAQPRIAIRGTAPASARAHRQRAHIRKTIPEARISGACRCDLPANTARNDTRNDTSMVLPPGWFRPTNKIPKASPDR